MMSAMDSVFALFDDCDATPADPRSRLCTGWVREHRCTDPATLDATWAAVRADLAAGLHAVLLADYEWGVALQLGRPARPAAAMSSVAETAPTSAPALRLLMFRDCVRLDAAAVDAWLQAQDAGHATPSPAGVVGLQPARTDADFNAAVTQIQDWIRAGETYQINHTECLHGRAVGTPLALYRRLRALQPVPYGALIALPPDESAVAAADRADGGADPAARQRWVLSCSPELFLCHRARHADGRRNVLQARPMKGTTARRADPAEDAAAAAWLAADVKNRAENLMITDLLRNDLGRVARVGTVRVPQLFAVEPYRTVHQMTSTIEAERRPDADLPALLRALFPCGSITGAPRHHTLELIERLEPAPRGLYTGAIGWLDAPVAAPTTEVSAPGAMTDDAAAAATAAAPLGDFCCAVAIRTLTLGPQRADGARAATLGVGAGITLDSDPAEEAAECRLKARFLSTLDPGFTLFETLRITPDRQVARLDAHLARLTASARALGFRCDAAEVRVAIAAAVLQLPEVTAVAAADTSTAAPVRAAPGWRLRLDLAWDGTLRTQAGVLAPLPSGPVRLLLADQPLPPLERSLLGHKTSLRQHYDAAIRAAEAVGAFDQLFFDADGRLTEGGRCNVFVRLDGRWCTPPSGGPSAGLLPGVMRAALLAEPALGAIERPILRTELVAAEALLVCNALRGALAARLGD